MRRLEPRADRWFYNSNKAAMAEVDMVKPILMSRQGIITSSKEVAMTRMLGIHTPNNQAIPMPHNPLRHNQRMEGDSNRGTTTIDTGKHRLRPVATRVIQVVPLAVATVRKTLRILLGRALIDTRWRK